VNEISVCCRQCMVVLLAALYTEGDAAPANSLSATGPRLAARWWERSQPEPDGPDFPLKRFGFDCGGRKHHRGVVTLARLDALYEGAIAKGEAKIHI